MAMAETAASAVIAVSALNANPRPRRSQRSPARSAAPASSPRRPYPEASGGPPRIAISTAPYIRAPAPVMMAVIRTGPPMTAPRGPVAAAAIFSPASTAIITANTMTVLVP